LNFFVFSYLSFDASLPNFLAPVQRFVTLRTTLSTPDKTSTQAAQDARTGLLFGMSAYLWWGGMPLYFKLLADVPPLQVLAHRVVWSVVFLAVVIALQKRGGEVCAALRDRRVLLMLVGSTLSVAVNWYVFIWAVSNDHVMQAALGYYINPLIVALMGVVFLREKLRPAQVVAVLLAAVGVTNMAVGTGVVPWASLALAVSFGLYGLIRKQAPVKPVPGLLVETLLLLPLSLGVMLYPVATVTTSNAYDPTTIVFLGLSGVVTALPLIWFAAAAGRLRFVTLGMLQYIAPTGQFLLAVLLYNEPFTRTHAILFAFIWSAVALYTFDSVRAYQQRPKTITP